MTSGICWTESTAKTLYASSFNNIEATANAILKLQPVLVTIVAMGAGGEKRTDEDELCAYYLRSHLEDRQPDTEAIKSLIRCGNTYQNYSNLGDLNYPGDAEIALQFDIFNFAIRVCREENFIIATLEYNF